MGLLRGLGKFLGSTIFTTCLALAILMMEMVNFTTYNNFNSLAGNLIGTQLFSSMSENDLASLKQLLLYQCTESDTVGIPNLGGLSTELKCSDVKNSDSLQLKSLITGAVTNGIYYRKFDCSFIDCVRRGLSSTNTINLQTLDSLIIVSHEGNLFYKKLVTYMWIGTIAGLALFLISAETWPGRLKGVGWNLVFTALPVVILAYISPKFVPELPQDIESSVKPVINGLIKSINIKFMIVLAIGIILVIAGFILGHYLSKKLGKKRQSSPSS